MGTARRHSVRTLSIPRLSRGLDRSARMLGGGRAAAESVQPERSEADLVLGLS